MDQFKEFQGKDLDECIKEACAYFDTPREKLEVEILQDAKSGIFGIVGARKAKIQARKIHLPETMQNLLEPEEISIQVGSSKNKPAKNQDKPFKKRQNGDVKKQQAHARSQDQHKSSEKYKPRIADKTEELEDIEEYDSYSATPFEELDKTKLTALSIEVIKKLLNPIAGKDVEANIDLRHGRVRAKVEWQGDAGLLIGREGQTLAALQYLAGRILSRSMDASVRVQLEIGDYKSRQDDKLRDIAKALADKARHTGRSWSTRPLTSYHRRIIHMVLQDEIGIITRSAGDGPLKRVIIAPKRDQE